MATEQSTGTRRDILDAAQEVIRDRGLGGATTRAIAERAGCAEGSIYRHFPDKIAVFMEIVRTRYPTFLELMGSLPDRAGTGTVAKNLEEVFEGGLEFHRGIAGMLAGAMAQRDLLLELRDWFLEAGKGPLKHLEELTTYLRLEQRLGRISSRASPEHVARLLLGTSFAQSFLTELMGERAALGTDRQFARLAVRNVMEGLAPEE
jgi:AcrR family transcriptional regulator